MITPSMGLGVFLACATVLPTIVAAAAKNAAGVLPKDAAQVITSVADAARKRDLASLRSLMVEKFTWSFGGDRSANQAIEEWKRAPRYLSSLDRVLRKGCRPAEADHVECPGGGGLSFRAGFVKTVNGWKMEYFVEGD